MMFPSGGMPPMNGAGGGAGMPDLEQAGPDYEAMMAQAAGAGGGMGMGMPCPACGGMMGPGGSCPGCGYSEQPEGAMDPAALAALFGQGEPPAPGGVNAVPPPGSTDTTGADGDEQSLQQLLALLQMLQTQGGPPGMPPGAGGPPPGMGGPPPGAGGGGNPLTAAMGGR